MPITDWLLPELDTDMATTRCVLERVPLDDPQWNRHEKSMPIGAQLGVYLRLRGVPVPSMVGPSADEQTFN